MKTRCHLFSLAALLVLLGSLSLGCQQRYYSEEEAITLIWARLPVYLTEYDRSQFDPESREATYLGKGKWLFEASGSVSEKEILQRATSPRSLAQIMEEQLGVTRTFDIKLTAHFYEKTGVIEILDIEKFNIVSK